MKTLIIIFILFLINLNLSADNYEQIKFGNNITVNICDNYPFLDRYNWKVSLPENSEIDSSIFNNFKKNCLISFKPDVKGEYSIEIDLDLIIEAKPQILFFEFEVIESLKKSNIDIVFLHNNKYYYDIVDYYEFSNHNKLEFVANKELKKINFEIEGIALVRDIFFDNYFLINSNMAIYLKDNYDYEINFYPNNYKSFQSKINISNYNKDNLNLIPIEKYIDLNITNFQDKKIIGITTVYYEDIEISKFSSKNTSVDNAKSILFTPIKHINNYPSILHNGSFEENINLKYDDIKFHKLNILTKNMYNQHSVIKIKSLNLDKCLINMNNSSCKYERTINSKIEINSNTEVFLPAGEYEITIYENWFNEELKLITLNKDENLLINKSSKLEGRRIDNLEVFTKILSFNNQKNQNYFFDENYSGEMYIPNGLYNITLFMNKGLLEMKDVLINDSANLSYKRSESFLEFLVKKNNKELKGGIILFNDNYQFNNIRTVDLYYSTISNKQEK